MVEFQPKTDPIFRTELGPNPNQVSFGPGFVPSLLHLGPINVVKVTTDIFVRKFLEKKLKTYLWKNMRSHPTEMCVGNLILPYVFQKSSTVFTSAILLIRSSQFFDWLFK